MWITLFMFCGIDMIGEVPSRKVIGAKQEVQSEEPIVHASSENIIPDELNKNVESENTPAKEKPVKEKPVKEKPVKAQPTKEKRAKEDGLQNVTKDSKDATKYKLEIGFDPIKKIESACAVVKNRDYEDNLSKKIKAEPVKDNLKYIVHTTNNCGACIKLLTELYVHVDKESVTVLSDSVTKSGHVIIKYPVLEVYSGDNLIFEHVGYLPYSNIKEKTGAAE